MGDRLTDDEAVELFSKRMAGDPECDHAAGDAFVADVLEKAGYPKLAAAYGKASEDWWYA